MNENMTYFGTVSKENLYLYYYCVAIDTKYSRYYTSNSNTAYSYNRNCIITIRLFFFSLLFVCFKINNSDYL
ncbi:hypothetical protein KUTeg_013385 [Tegillarca granosa]|uniref:Uncharacterized protein n=1 Tax=Tegillarca granosa TaxID=220873 RepID=A0ABQ9ETI4_TEGGR|nr:hypothetical protein KUTeg_013385 [Tegillarca granosa]